MEKEKILNIPNILSAYRLLSFPFVLYLIYAGRENFFAWMLCVNLVTDILDGLIARAFNMQTALGARLDSLADIGTYMLALVGVYRFKLDEIGGDVWLLCFTVILFATGYIVSFIRFGQYQSFHLLSAKISGYALGIFFFVLFMFTYQSWLYFIAMTVASLAFAEEIVILFIIRELRSDVRGLPWLMRETRNGS